MKRKFKFMIGFIGTLGVVLLRKWVCTGIDKQNELKVRKYISFYKLMDRWVTIHEEGKTLESILMERNMRTVAVYGLGEIGKHVITQLSGSKIQVRFAMDRAIKGYWKNVEVLPLSREIPEVDAIIVTAINDMDEIEPELKKYTKCRIVSLEELLYEG